MATTEQITSVTATYKPQNGQTYRCSPNFPKWDTPKGGKLLFTVSTDPGAPLPTFSIVHDKTGQDKTWYTGLFNGIVIDVNSQEGEGGKHDIYVATTSELNPEFSGAGTFTVTVSKVSS